MSFGRIPALIAALIALAPAAPRFSDEASRVDRVLALENDRLALMPAVAAWKWQHHAPVTDAARERVILADTARLARPLGLDGERVERLFALQMRLARGVETDRLSEWRRKGFDFKGPVPDLAGVLRPRLDRLTGELLRALYLAAPALSRPDFAARYAAAARRRLSAAEWTRQSRGELLEALARIRLEPMPARSAAQASSSATQAAPPRVQAAPALQRIRSAGVLRIGTTGDYAPFSIEEGGRLAGVDIDLARSLAQALGVAPVFVRTSWRTLLEDLHRGAFDVAIGGISATPARAAAAALSIPYFTGGKTIAARCEDAGRFRSLAAVDRPGIRVIVNPGGTNEQYVRGHLHRARILIDPNNETLFDALAARRADVIITDETEVDLQVRRHPDLCRALSGTLTRADKIILTARDPALTHAVNEWLRRELAAGVPAQLMREALGAAAVRRPQSRGMRDRPSG